MPEFIDRACPLTQAVTQRLDRHVEAQLVTVLEAIRHGLGRLIDRHLNALNRVMPSLGGQQGFMCPDDTEADWRMGGHPFLAPNCHPGLVRRLGGETMELQCGQETDDPMRDCLACFNEAVVRCYVRIGSLVKSTPDAHEAAFLAQALEIGPGDASVCDVTGANDALGFGQGQDAVPRTRFVHHG